MNTKKAILFLTAVVFVSGCSADAGEPAKNIPPEKSTPAASSTSKPIVEPAVQSSTVVSQTSVIADTVVLVQSEPQPPAKRYEDKWSPEAIQRDPYGFIQDQIRDCDKLKAKLESKKISLTRLGKQSARTIEESDGMVARYTAFLAAAKKAYKEAEAAGVWPATVNGYELDEEQLSDRIADALERIELAKKDRETAESLAKKVELRQKAVKAKTRELSSLRLQLVQQAERVKANAALEEVGDLSSVLGALHDMTLEVDEDFSSASLDDLADGYSDAKKKSTVRAFLDD